MKLRVSGNSIRLRLLRSEVETFMDKGRIEEKVQFAVGEDACLTYAMEWESGPESVDVRYQSCEVVVVLPREIALAWAGSEQVGIYAAVAIGSFGSLKVVVEKDFACLDRSDADNEDTFPHPQMGAVC